MPERECFFPFLYSVLREQKDKIERKGVSAKETGSMREVSECVLYIPYNNVYLTILVMKRK